MYWIKYINKPIYIFFVYLNDDKKKSGASFQVLVLDII